MLPARHLVDTSALARAREPAIRDALESVVASGSELVLPAPVVIEMLREPTTRPSVARRCEELLGTFRVLYPDRDTFRLAFDAMARLADVAQGAHRVPITDLIVAALAHQHGCVLLHVDGDFEVLAAQAGIPFAERRLPAASGMSDAPPGTRRQRELRRQLAAALHALPAEVAIEQLERSLALARAASAG